MPVVNNTNHILNLMPNNVELAPGQLPIALQLNNPVAQIQVINGVQDEPVAAYLPQQNQNALIINDVNVTYFFQFSLEQGVVNQEIIVVQVLNAMQHVEAIYRFHHDEHENSDKSTADESNEG